MADHKSEGAVWLQVLSYNAIFRVCKIEYTKLGVTILLYIFI